MKVTNEQIEQWRQFVAEFGGFGGQLACAKEYGVSVKTVQKHTGDIMQALLKARNEKIIEYRRNLMTQAEIADALGISKDIVRIICKKAGMGGQIRSNWATLTAMEAQKRGREKAHSRIKAEQEAKYREQVEVAGLQYLGGYTTCDGYVNVRYPLCGHDGRLSITTLRHQKRILPCAVCAEERRQIAEAERAKRKTEEREEKAKAKELKRKEKEAHKVREKEQRRWKSCAECGNTFFDESNSNHKRYCSSACSNRAHNRQKDAKRRGYKANGTLTKLYRRDGGRCYICGCSCDFEDYQIIDGAFVVGKTYPTVEHVIPICRGGDDGQDNIRLACHRCNSAKSIISEYQVENTGQIAWVI